MTGLNDPMTFWTAVVAVGTVVGAVGTVGTLIWAVWNGLSLRKAALEERRIGQARKVFAWVDDVTLDVILGNHSDESVYEVILYLVWVQMAKPHTGEEAESMARDNRESPMRSIVRQLPPGDWRVEITGPSQWGAGLAHLSVEMAFTDSANHHWVRRADGRGLEILTSNPATHYAIDDPLRYATLQDRGSIDGG
jgi:hypothetical protein